MIEEELLHLIASSVYIFPIVILLKCLWKCSDLSCRRSLTISEVVIKKWRPAGIYEVMNSAIFCLHLWMSNHVEFVHEKWIVYCQIISYIKIQFYFLSVLSPLHNLSSIVAGQRLPLFSRIQVVKMAQRLRIIIFGATGYTGKIVVEKIVSLAQKKNLSWGIAGRSQEKLQKVLDDVSKEKGYLFWNIQYFVTEL